jgi:hypothetical protein
MLLADSFTMCQTAFTVNEDRIYLPHFSEGMAGRIVTKGHGNFIDLKIERDFRNCGPSSMRALSLCKLAVAKNHGAPKGWVASEWNLSFRNEDSDFDAAFTLDSGIAREYESSFLEIRFTGDALHLEIAESTRVQKDSKRVSLQPLRGEYIDLNKMKAPALLLGGFVARQRRSYESGGYASGVRVQKITTRRFHKRVPPRLALYHTGNQPQAETTGFFRFVGRPSTTTHPAQGFGSMPMRSLTADRIRCLQPR